MFKILSKKKYQELKNKLECCQNMYEQEKTELMVDNQDFELRLETVHDLLLEIKHLSKTKTSKDTLFKKVNNVIYYIEKGKIR